MKHLKEILKDIESGEINSSNELQKAKMKYCKEYGVSELPKNSELLEHVNKVEGIQRKDVVSVLQRKPARKKSGVTVIACMTSPAECPHGRCIMCPGGPEKDLPSPQSYTGKEPAALRAERNDFDPRWQVEDRLRQYDAIGHKTDKVDLIVMGGTFPARDWGYQKRFVKGCLDGLNGSISESLEESKTINETADIRCIGLTIETRPDYCKEPQLDRMLELGATRVEIGVQTLDDDLLKNIQRGHTVKDTIEATWLAKEKGFKVCYHMMPGLPGSDFEKDREEFKKLFEDERYRPDMLKIYPTLVVEGTELYDMWKEGQYTPLDTDEASTLVAKMKAGVPPYVRIQRVQRDIPSPLVEAGVKKSNLRQYAKKELNDRELSCRCIRCREAGHSNKEIELSDIDMKIIDYRASGGREYFLELGDGSVLVGYARLRICEDNSPVIRELKVVGSMTPVEDESEKYQHKGFGKRLLDECERLASDEFDSLRVISGVGAREYYRNLGYSLKGPYMVKRF
ncbi:MAG: tRNA uridine(34) 5-carboxymethylaminomethyl modification radical SAM/GNAT enzyme Elp3 [Candidatus Saliniplasma sp.]